jgi:hypothetical protein
MKLCARARFSFDIPSNPFPHFDAAALRAPRHLRAGAQAATPTMAAGYAQLWALQARGAELRAAAAPPREAWRVAQEQDEELAAAAQRAAAAAELEARRVAAAAEPVEAPTPDAGRDLLEAHAGESAGEVVQAGRVLAVPQ